MYKLDMSTGYIAAYLSSNGGHKVKALYLWILLEQGCPGHLSLGHLHTYSTGIEYIQYRHRVWHKYKHRVHAYNTVQA